VSELQNSTTTTPVPIPPVPVAAPQQPPEPPSAYAQRVAPATAGVSSLPAATLPRANESGLANPEAVFDVNIASAQYNTWTCKKLSEELGRRLLARSGNKVCSQWSSAVVVRCSLFVAAYCC